MKVLNLLKNKVIIRQAVKEDCPQLLKLMRQLAVFECYIEDFNVSIDDLIKHGFSKQHPSTYKAIVAEVEGELLGYLVYYLIPFTYDLKPTLFIKELYVSEQSRGLGVGKGLMRFTINEAENKKCGRMKWDVLSDNINAQKFYQSFGALYDDRWQGYVLKL